MFFFFVSHATLFPAGGGIWQAPPHICLQLVRLRRPMSRGGNTPIFDPEPWLGSLQDGATVSVAGRAWLGDSKDRIYRCCTSLKNQQFLLSGVQLRGDRFSVVAATKQTSDGLPMLLTDQKDVLVHQEIERGLATQVIDICSGFAVMTTGYHTIDCSVRCHVEINPTYAAWLRGKQYNVIEGDIDSFEVQKALLPYVTTPCIITGGFSCQPFSHLGDQRQQLDPRARSFEGMITTCYIFQPVAMLLECTREAMTSPWIQGTLDTFCKHTGYTLQQQVCHLQDLWPAKRSRWWAVMTHPYIKMPPLQKFPTLDFQPSFRHLIPRLADWPEPQVVELQLTPHELEAFADQPGGLGKNSVSPCQPLATALHAWGSQLTACACGCRSGGFTPQRIEDRGLYGALIPIQGSTQVKGQDMPSMRHVHPDEVALLNMVPTDHLRSGAKRDLRLDLTALGQMASPAQALWRMAQIVQAIEQAYGAPPDPKFAEKGMLQLATEVFAARDDMLRPFAHTKESKLFQEAVYARFGATYEATIMTGPQVLASAASEKEPRHRDSSKRKAVADAHEPKGLSSTGGIEFFANKTIASIQLDCQIPQPDMIIRRPAEAKDFGPDCLSDAKSFEVPKAPTEVVPHLETGPRPGQPDCQFHVSRGKGKGGSVPSMTSSSESTKVHNLNIAWSCSSSPELAKDIPREESPLPRSECLSLLPQDDFLITVCSLESAPIQVRVRPGITVGQLSQAEAGVDSFAQPIVVTNLTGLPLPLSSLLTPASWYVVANGATHAVPTCAKVHAKQTLVVDTGVRSRFQCLLQQGPLVATDEMEFYATLVRNQGHQVNPPIIIDQQDDPDQLLATWVLQCVHDHEEDAGKTKFMAPVLLNCHWSPIAIQAEGHTCTMFVPATFGHVLQNIVVDACGPNVVDISTFVLPNGFAADCGFQTVKWMFGFAVGSSHTSAVAASQADQWRVPFAMHIMHHKQASKGPIRLGGTLHPDQLILQALLKQHGVSSDRVDSCAVNLIHQLGQETITKVLQSPQPWKDLKTRASQASPPIRIVLAAEVDQAIKARIATGKPIGTKANKKPSVKGPKPQVVPSADQIRLPDGLFVQQDGHKLPTIALHKVEAHAQGVALCNIDEVVRFLTLTAPISAEGIALLVLDHADARLPPCAEQIRLPAMSVSTGEAMLISVAMLQLGSKQVKRHVAAESFALDEIQTRVLKVLIYRDEWPGAWANFSLHPVKAVFEHSLMNLEEFPQSEHILDVWDRQPLDLKLSKAAVGQAEIFVFLVRVTSSFADQLMPNAAVDGIYIEPRTLDGRRPDPAYRVIWMPRHTLAQMRLAKSQTDARTTIVRMGMRYGLRVDKAKAEQVHLQHRPDLMYLDGQELKPYKVGPFPYGSTKASLSKGFKHLGWNARPVQPMSQLQVQEGIFWQVTAPQEPSHWIYQMKHGDILIAKIEDQKEAALPMTKNIIASKKTISTLTQSTPETAVDPWLQYDPWKGSVQGRKSSGAPLPAAVTPSQLAALEQRLEQKIHATAGETQEDTMQIEQTERIEALENKVHQLTQNFSAFQGQQAKVNHQLSTQLQGFEGRIDARLDDQMQRIEALLSKKMRHE